MNKNNAAAIIDGPEGVLNSNDENRPIKTDNNPPIIENNTCLLYTSPSPRDS